MKSQVYKIIELVGSSPDSIEDAVQSAINRAGRTVRNLRWFEVVQIRGCIESGAPSKYQVHLKAGFSLDEEG
jgi:dodecin